MFRLHRPLARERVDAAIGEGRSYDCEVHRVDQQRALTEIEIEVVLDVAVDHSGVQLQKSNCAVSVTRGAFGAIDILIHRQAPSGEGLEHVEDPFETFSVG